MVGLLLPAIDEDGSPAVAGGLATGVLFLVASRRLLARRPWRLRDSAEPISGGRPPKLAARWLAPYLAAVEAETPLVA